MLTLHEELGPIEQEGVEERIVGYDSLPAREANRKNQRNWMSYKAKDGRYVYEEYDQLLKRAYFHIITIKNESLINYLDYTDKEVEKRGREIEENTSYAQVYYYYHGESTEENGDPHGQDLYRRWQREAVEEIPKQLPLHSLHAVIRCVVQRIPESERIVYELLFDSYLTEEEIKKELKLSDSAWSNRKTRFWDYIRRAFSDLGYNIQVALSQDKTETDKSDNILGEIKTKATAEHEVWEWEKVIARDMAKQ